MSKESTLAYQAIGAGRSEQVAAPLNRVVTLRVALGDTLGRR